jgi:hypothetical protein
MGFLDRKIVIPPADLERMSTCCILGVQLVLPAGRGNEAAPR